MKKRFFIFYIVFGAFSKKMETNFSKKNKEKKTIFLNKKNLIFTKMKKRKNNFNAIF